MKFRTTWIIFEALILLDLITTFIALNFLGLVETTPLPRSLFNLGWYGWIIVFFINSAGAFFSALMCFVPSKIINYKEKMFEKIDKKLFGKVLIKIKDMNKISIFSFYTVFISLVSLWIYVILHNLLLIIEHL